jgi:hypothetical protein
LTIAAAGCGITGAASLHFAVELAVPDFAAPAPALLVIPGELGDERDARLVAWIEPAVARALQHCPLRV